MTTTLLSREALEKWIETEGNAWDGFAGAHAAQKALTNLRNAIERGTFSPSPPGSGVLPNKDGLLPCPFCGERAFGLASVDMVSCTNMSCIASRGSATAEKWNTRNTGGGCEQLKNALSKLVFAARTSGGTAGPDPELMAACEIAESLLNAG